MYPLIRVPLIACFFLLAILAAPVKADALTPHEIFQRLHPSVVVLHKTDLFGSTFRSTGFFIAPNLIATNFHVVKEVRDLRIEGVNGSSFTFYKVHAEDPTADTAIIEVRETSPHILKLDPISRIKVGQQVYVIGNPKGYVRSLSQGLVSGIRRVNGGPLYQVTANVAQGSSGSPVIDDNGRAIGIIFGRLENEAQIAFATPAANLAALKNGSWKPERNTGADGILTSRGLPPEIEPVNFPATLSPSRTTRDFIRIGVPSWDSAAVVAHVLKEAIEHFFPITVGLIPGTNDEIFHAIAESDRSYDVHPDVWLPNHHRFLTDESHLTKPSYVGAQGICVPRYVYSRLAIRSRSDLANPAVARLFDRTGDGRGDLWIGEADWQSTRIEQLKARDYRYGPYFNLLIGEERRLYRDLDRAIAAREPIAFFCYGPHWVLRKHDLTILEGQPHSKDCFHLADSERGRAWYDRSQASCAAPTTTVHRAYSNYVAKNLPQVAAFIEAFSIKYEEVNELIFRTMGSDRDSSVIARAWVRENEQRLQRDVRTRAR